MKKLFKDRLIMTGDYETITRGSVITGGVFEDVWLWDMCNINNLQHTTGTTMEDFLKTVNNFQIGADIYFHNLKFDGSFILDYLLKNGYELSLEKSQKLHKGEINPLITEQGQFMCFTFKNKKSKIIKIYDSFKIIPLSIEKIACEMDLPIKKGKINYTKKREIGYIPSQNEIEYIHNDTEIAARALKIMIEQGHEKMTISGCAFEEYKKIVGKKYNSWFGEWEKKCDIDLDKFIRKAYRGGFCLPNQKYLNKTIKKPVYYYDVNSLYPHVMHSHKLPYGMPVYFKGEYQNIPDYPYYVQRIKIDMSVKTDGIPCILWDRNIHASEYIVDTMQQSELENVIELTVTNFDLELIKENYKIYNIEYIDGYAFRIKGGLFTEYVEKHVKAKEKATRDRNKALRLIEKLLMNSLYGKFGQNPIRFRKIPFIDNDGKLKYKISEGEISKKFKYLPVAVFITSLARYKIIKDIKKIGVDNWIYSDTDSIFSFVKFDQDMVDEVKLGKYKLEHFFKKTKVLGPKSYYGIEPSGKSVVKLCGCSPASTKTLPIGQFDYGKEVKNGRITLKTVVGGKKLDFASFNIKDRNTIHIDRNFTIEELKKNMENCLINSNNKKILKKIYDNKIKALINVLKKIDK